MQDILKKVHQLLIKKKKTVATAESCTGGLLSYSLTKIPGSSQYFLLGVCAYSNKAKIDILKIPSLIIQEKGAVSKETAKLMAHSVRNLAKSDFGIGITGIAGPTGASPSKPVGTVFIAIDKKNKTLCKKFIFTGSRNHIRRSATLKALLLLKRMLS